MKSMMLTGIRQMEMKTVADPIIVNDTDVLIRMERIGVCGSDVHYYTAGRIGSQVVKYPFPVGHEGAGTVLKTGPAVTCVRPGARIAIEPAMACGKCDQCLTGRSHTCRNLRFLGCPGQADGSLSEYIVMPENSCYPVPDHVSFEQAALSEPLSIGIYALKLSGSPLTGKKIGILGCGPIGMSVLLPALTEGIERVYVTDRIDQRLGIASDSGASWTGNPDNEDIVAAISEMEPLLLDVVFECCGQQEAMDQAVQLLKPGGRIIIVGIPEFDRWSFPTDIIRRKELCLQNVRRQNECYKPALEMISSGRIKVDHLITHHFRFEKTKEAFDLVEEYRDGVMKAMIEF
jgi:L-iditol 2-dehydrogenase